jgi:bifunctional non-homologous end joining protein LigD
LGRHCREGFSARRGAVEAVCLGDDGRADFNRLRTRQGCAEARLMAFDLLERDGEDLRALPLDERRPQLEWLLKDAPEALWYSSDVEGRYGPALFRHACAIGVEGIIAKRRDMPYPPAASSGGARSSVKWAERSLGQRPTSLTPDYERFR